MVERSRRGKGKKKFLGSHQKAWVWGRNAVVETLQAGKWAILELYLAEDRLTEEQLHVAQQRARELGVPVAVESAEALRKRCHSSEHQGYLARMSPYPYADAAELLRTTSPESFFVVLDSIQDPYNFGAMIRTAEVLGVDGVFIGQTQQVEVTSLVVRTSAGAVNHVRIARVNDLTKLVEELRSRDIQVVAASEKASVPLFDSNFRGPTAVVIGNEGAGIREAVLKSCTGTVTIPQVGRTGSLNAAVSAGIVLYEVRRQRARQPADR